MRMFIFQTAGHRYALDAACVQAVHPLVRAKPVPGAPAWLAGVIDVHGELVPMVDAAMLLSGTACVQRTLGARVLLVDTGIGQSGGARARFALAVDRVLDAVALEQEVRLAGIQAVAEELIRTAIHQAAGHDPNRARVSATPEPPALAIWNPERQAGAGVVIAETTWFERDELVGPPGGREPREGQPQEEQGHNGQPGDGQSPSADSSTDPQQRQGSRPTGRGNRARPEDQSEDRQQPNGDGSAAESENDNPQEPRAGTGSQRNPQGRPRSGQPRGEQPNPNGETQPGQEPGAEPGEAGEPSEQTANGEPQDQPGNAQSRSGRGGNRPGNRAGQRPGTARPGEESGEEPGDDTTEPQMSQDESPSEDEEATGQPAPGARPNASPRSGGTRNRGGNPQRGPTGPLDRVTDAGGFAPFTGRDFREWSDRLRDVEEMVSDPELRAEAARIRDRARAIRGDARRNSAEPNWDLVRMQVANPLAELSRRVNDELLRRQNRQNVIPLDRDQVPPRYSEKTRKYYERLGSGQ